MTIREKRELQCSFEIETAHYIKRAFVSALITGFYPVGPLHLFRIF